MRRFCVGDIHGNIYTLNQCLERAGFKEDDLLIGIGDYVDGWPDSQKVIDKLLTVKNFIGIMGNHDWWFAEFAHGRHPGAIWIEQGGRATYESYPSGVPMSHMSFLSHLYLYYVLDDMVFVHGGLDPNQNDMRKQDRDLLMWDRNLVRNAFMKKQRNHHVQYGDWKKIFVGHTTTTAFNTTTPLIAGNLIDLDTGGGYEGKLTIMDIDTGEFFQSDHADTFYPQHRGRFHAYSSPTPGAPIDYE